MNKKQVNKYFKKTMEVFNKKFFEKEGLTLVTDTYSILSITDTTNLEKGNDYTDTIFKMYDDFRYNFEYQYTLDSIDFNNDYLDIDPDKLNIDNKYKKDINFCINLKYLKTLLDITKADTINIKTKFGFYSYQVIIELVKDNYYSYMLPCRTY